ncbi:beta-N-acetylhexosaminidase [Vibrio crassostreae]|nr:beta-N-acetylhexosaminidase [Vibrio crassostreae]
MKHKLLATCISAATLAGCATHVETMTSAQWLAAQANPSQSAAEIVSKMSDRELIGQTMMIDFRSWGTDQHTGEPLNVTVMNDDIRSIINDYHLGGVILFRQNVINTTQTVKLVKDIQDARSNLPLFVSIDQEGGYVTRLQEGTEMPGNMALGATNNAKWAYEAGRVHGAELSSMGINFNLGPVVDVNANQNNPVIGVRSYSSDLGIINEMSTGYLKGIQQYGMTVALKHFPGHGNVSVDSHYALPEVGYSAQEWERVDLAAFKNAMKNGADSVVTAHVSVPAVDDTVLTATKTGDAMRVPATFSKKILTGVLREQLHFDGLILTDALDMGAIAKNFEHTDAVKMALTAGADIALMPVVMSSMQDAARLEELYETLESDMAKDPEFKARITEAAKRIVRIKLEKGISAEPVDLEKAKMTVASESNKQMEVKIAEKSITLIENDNVLPIALADTTNVLVISDEQSRNELIESELRNIAGDSPIFVNKMKLSMMESGVSEDALKKNINAADFVILATYNLKPGAENAQAVINATNDLGKKAVVIATRNPYDIGYLTDVKANIAIYGITGFDVTNANRNSLEANIRAGVRTLFTDLDGQPLNNPTAKLPVAINDANGNLLFPLGHGNTYSF